MQVFCSQKPVIVCQFSFVTAGFKIKVGTQGILLPLLQSGRVIMIIYECGV